MNSIDIKEEILDNHDGVRGYKAFNPDWSCTPSTFNKKQYNCPGVFETTTKPSVCNHGMYFCERLEDIFNYYRTEPNKPKVAEVIARGAVAKRDDKCSTNKLEIVREIPWKEVLERTNSGSDCTGVCNAGNWNTGNHNAGNGNTGDHNTGNHNAGNGNTGDHNTGNGNTGNHNTGSYNTRDFNTGNYNAGYENTGYYNTGDCNTGDCNTGHGNTGDHNTGNRNAGNGNTGGYNTGDHNTGNGNTGDHNTGNHNAGDWNSTDFSAGCFCTEEPEILMFNKPSGMTLRQWRQHPAHAVLNQIPMHIVTWVSGNDMSDEEKNQYPTYKTTGGYLKILDEQDTAQRWWDSLASDKKSVVLGLPNFDADIFYQCTGIKVH